MTVHLRDAIPGDVPAILAIYNAVIETSTAIYISEPVTLQNRLDWFTDRTAAGFPVLVAEAQGVVAGFATYGEWRGSWPGYLYTVEHSVHVDSAVRGQGVGRHLMLALIDRATAQGKHVMLGAVDAANAPSLAFHRSLGFEPVSHFKEVGRKFDRWLDLVFVQKILDAPGAPRP